MLSINRSSFARVEELFRKPFQMPIPGEGVRVDVDAWLDQPVVGAYEPLQNRGTEAPQMVEAAAPGAAFAGPEDPTEQIQVPSISATPPSARQPLYKRVFSSLFQ